MRNCSVKEAILRLDLELSYSYNSWLQAEQVPNPGNSQLLIGEQDQSHLHFIMTQEFPGTASLRWLKCVGFISPRPSVSGYWPERFPNTLVTEHKHSHQEEIVPFGLLEGGGHARMRDSKYGSLRNICLWSKHWEWRNIHKCQWTKWGHSPNIMLVVLSE